MTRLLVHVEGESEEVFVNEVLRAHLYAHGYTRVDARLLGESDRRAKRGGIKDWTSARQGIVAHLTGDTQAVATTMVDYYGMPASGNRAWPGRVDAANRAIARRAAHVQNCLADSVAEVMGGGFNRRRFLPFVMLHEFEALLFSDCAAFAEAIDGQQYAGKLQAVRDGFKSPEEIDDFPESAPSKRIASIIVDYDKLTHGNIGILEIGLPAIRAECPHFAAWLTALEQLPQRVYT